MDVHSYYLWTHGSTAIEGNTLSLAETHFVLSEGLTIKGKPLRDHNEVVGHARAIELLYAMRQREVSETDLFDLHRAVQTDTLTDILRPNGAWKREPNGTYGIASDGQRIFIEFALPEDVPRLMREWIDALNAVDLTLPATSLTEVYARLHVGFTAVHPFWDGNGRLARILSNLPLLKAGHPPLLIDSGARQDYIAALNAYSAKAGRPTLQSALWSAGEESWHEFTAFCSDQYRIVQTIVDEAWAVQRQRG
jgi:Fic family protein